MYIYIINRRIKNFIKIKQDKYWYEKKQKICAAYIILFNSFKILRYFFFFFFGFSQFWFDQYYHIVDFCSICVFVAFMQERWERYKHYCLKEKQRTHTICIYNIILLSGLKILRDAFFLCLFFFNSCRLLLPRSFFSPPTILASVSVAREKQTTIII